MKIVVETSNTGETQNSNSIPIPLPHLVFHNKPVFPRKPPRRRAKFAGEIRRDKTAFKLPETPFLGWKFDEENENYNSAEEEEISSEIERENGNVARSVISARKLGAGLWRMQLSEFQRNGDRRSRLQSGNCDEIGIIHSSSVVSALRKELDEARARISKLETERSTSKKKLEQFLLKISDECSDWRSRESEKIRLIMEDTKSELSREKKNRRRLEIVNSKLATELADAKRSMEQSIQEYEKERQARELIEEVCDELAKDKAKIESFKRGSRKMWEEVDEERKMLQMAQVWREERVQMKLTDAKVMLEEKYSEMNNIISDLDAFLKASRTESDIERMEKAELLQEVAASITIQDIRDLKCELPSPDITFPAFRETDIPQSNDKEIELYATPEARLFEDEDASEWDRGSRLEDQGSSYSPGVSFRVGSDDSREWERVEGEGTPTTRTSEVGCPQPRLLEKAPSISRLWRSHPGNGLGQEDRGTKGCIERTHNVWKSSSRGGIPVGRVDVEKIRLREALEQEI